MSATTATPRMCLKSGKCISYKSDLIISPVDQPHTQEHHFTHYPKPKVHDRGATVDVLDRLQTNPAGPHPASSPAACMAPRFPHSASATFKPGRAAGGHGRCGGF